MAGRREMIAALLLACAASQKPAEPWTLIEPEQASTTAPDARMGHSSIDCPALGGVVVFGGLSSDGTLLADLWRVSSTETWVELSLAGGETVSPRARAYHAAVCTNTALLVIGGSCGDDCFLSDVWSASLDGAGDTEVRWTRAVVSGEAPAARAGHGAVWQGALGRTLLFGGQQLGGALLNDVWAFETSPPSWSELRADGSVDGPAGRREAAVALLDEKMHVVGGWRGAELLADHWQLEGNGRWTLVDRGGEAPQPRRGAATSTNAQGTAFALFGGASYGGVEQPIGDFNDVWLYEETEGWSLLSGGTRAPSTRRAAAIAWLTDAAQPTLALFAGARYTTAWTFLSDMWTLNVEQALAYAALYDEYLAGIRREERARAEEKRRRDARNDAGAITVNLQFLDRLLTSIPRWAAGMVVFGLPSACCCLCICSGLLRQRARSRARKRAQALERAQAEADE